MLAKWRANEAGYLFEDDEKIGYLHTTEDADRVVRAVNAHDDLLKTLRWYADSLVYSDGECAVDHGQRARDALEAYYQSANPDKPLCSICRRRHGLEVIHACE